MSKWEIWLKRGIKRSRWLIAVIVFGALSLPVSIQTKNAKGSEELSIVFTPHAALADAPAYAPSENSDATPPSYYGDCGGDDDDCGSGE